MKLLVSSTSLAIAPFAAFASASNSTSFATNSIPSSFVNVTASERCACTQLTRSFGSSVIYPGQANYTFQTVDSYWDVWADFSPACVFVPESASDVASAVGIPAFCDSKFAIRGGGHINVLAPYDRAAIGGRMKTIDVPGLTLIGGFHNFNNMYGHALDNVVFYDVVLGNETFVTASERSHPELFCALKGGANNFGIVMRFDMAKFDVPRSSIPAFIGAMCESARADGDQKDLIAAGMIATIFYNAMTKLHLLCFLGCKRPDSEALISIYKAWKVAVDEIADVEGLLPTFVLNKITLSSLRIAQENGVGNVWGLEPEPLMIWQFSTGWPNAADDERVKTWSQELTERLHAINQEKGIASEFMYMGDAGEWQDPFLGFPEDNVQRLKGVRDEYDPLGVFVRLNDGG
ncbi:hypothetical protein BDV11DRAFT_210441 [Aspergillus similis]